MMIDSVVEQIDRRQLGDAQAREPSQAERAGVGVAVAVKDKDKRARRGRLTDKMSNRPNASLDLDLVGHSGGGMEC